MGAFNKGKIAIFSGFLQVKITPKSASFANKFVEFFNKIGEFFQQNLAKIYVKKWHFFVDFVGKIITFFRKKLVQKYKSFHLF